MSKTILNIRQTKPVKIGVLCAHLLVFCLCFLPPCQAMAMDGPEARRLMAGLELFPSFLAADTEIKSKQNDTGSLQLVILYNTDKRTAERMASRLEQIGKIKSIPISTTVIKSRDFNPAAMQPAGIFISQDNIANLNAIIRYGRQNSIITFSPFTKDLQQGVTGSISITARIRPQVNMNTLKQSHLRIKPFFLRISKQYAN